MLTIAVCALVGLSSIILLVLIHNMDLRDQDVYTSRRKWRRMKRELARTRGKL